MNVDYIRLPSVQLQSGVEYLHIIMVEEFRVVDRAQHFGKNLAGVDRVFRFEFQDIFLAIFLGFCFKKTLCLSL